MALIPPLVYSTYVKFADSMINELGVNCTITYPALRVNCENCYNHTMPGLAGSNKYRPGGPYPFTSGLCPYCYGKNYREEITTDTIKIRAYFDKKSWAKVKIPIGIKDNAVMTIGFMSDLIKLQRAEYITLPSELIGDYSYELVGEILPWGLKRDRYVNAFWNRIST